MKKLFSIFSCTALVVMLAGCGGSGGDAAKTVEIISPDTLITAQKATDVAGAPMSMASEGVVNDGSARSVTYVSDEIGAADPVSVRIEQFSDSLSATQVWSDYENNRLRRSDMEFVTGVGEDCYIAYPYINVYDRGCYIRISAGTGDSDAQRDMLINLANQAVASLEEKVSAEAAEQASSNVIK